MLMMYLSDLVVEKLSHILLGNSVGSVRCVFFIFFCAIQEEKPLELVLMAMLENFVAVGSGF